ncbi:hypothetical protein D1BOALGB6SA_1879 [Olavius sp. associated proteobacterium Delta 1]|nr:hypothetical protein D1BOALGB6SA_1879 [Olavius sp. associated proteobacterium Delta 1]
MTDLVQNYKEKSRQMNYSQEKKTDKSSPTLSLLKLLLAVLTLILVITITESWAGGYHHQHDRVEIPFDQAQLVFELNNPDGDLSAWRTGPPPEDLSDLQRQVNLTKRPF